MSKKTTQEGEVEEQDQGEQPPSVYKGVDLESLPRNDKPEQYGKVLRVALWGENGLQREIISPTRDSEVRKPTSPKRTKLFKGIFQLQNSKKLEDGNWEERVNNKYRAMENSEKQFYFGF